MSLTKEELKYFEKLNQMREVVDTDPEWATEYIIDLEDKVMILQSFIKEETGKNPEDVYKLKNK
tara:strand:+ start:450 stop:641 length:192 start_codon:yes stop_codon:yes gene_type:complete